MTLIDLIIDQYERSSKWNGDFAGNSSFRVEEKHYAKVGKGRLIQEAKQLEEKKLLKICWVKGYYNVDVEKVEYPLESMKDFYEISGKLPKYQQMKEKLELVEEFYSNMKSSWIRRYSEQEIFQKLNKGAESMEKQSYEELRKLYKCFAGLDQLDTPVFKRVFSKRYLNNSKVFERELQNKVIRIARKYSEEIEDTMEDSEVLSQLYIEEYAQELSVKGSLRLEVSGSFLDTGVFPYGTVLNTQTLKNAVFLDNSQITKVLSIENKANFLAEPYEDGTLIIFSHGYFTPVEREFLKQLRDKLSSREVTYLHSGDLDYGGIRIFQYIRNRIFPEVKPDRMDLETFEQYLSFSEPIESGPMEKLKHMKEPQLQPVINRIIETGRIIEQEAFL